MKTLVLYVFHKINDNVIRFIRFSTFNHEDYSFVIICNSKDINIKDLNIPDYVTIIQRDNIGFDFGGWSEGLLQPIRLDSSFREPNMSDSSFRGSEREPNRSEQYDYFVFINSSVAGPMLPVYYKYPWPTVLTSGLTNDIKLFGTSICDYNEYAIYNGHSSHVQSFAFATDKIGLNILIEREIFSLTNISGTFLDAVQNKEIRMSQEIIRSNYNIGCLIHYYKGIDFRNLDSSFIPHEDVMWQGRYEEFKIHPYESVFIKTNRNIDLSIYEQYVPKVINLYTLYHELCTNRSEINEHLPIIKEHSSMCSSVMSLSLGDIGTTYSILYGLHSSSNHSLSSLSSNPGRESFPMERGRMYIGADYHFSKLRGCYPLIELIELDKNELSIDNIIKIDSLPKIDLLFIDSIHTYCHVCYQLETYSHFISKYIILHDTANPWGFNDDITYTGDLSEYHPSYDRNKFGVWPAIEDFLNVHKEWNLKTRLYNNHGLVILEHL